MDFLKKNYEKVLLGVVLLGLVIGAIFLLLMIPAERQKLQEMADEITRRPVKELPPLDVARALTLVQRSSGPSGLDLSEANRVFNPMQWQRLPDGRVVKITTGNELGPGAVVVTKITPLNQTITLDSVENIGGNWYYVITSQNEAAPRPNDRGRKRVSALPNAKKETFTIREVRGNATNAAEVTLVLELTDGEKVTLSQANPYRQVAGYMADFKYGPENKNWTAQRVVAPGTPATPIVIAGEQYNVIAITSNEVVLSAKSNNKKTPRPYNPAP